MRKLEYLDFDLLLESQGKEHYSRVVNAPAGEASATFEVPFSELELDNFLLRVGRPRRPSRRDTPAIEPARHFGARLFEGVFSGAVLKTYRASLGLAEEKSMGLRLRIRLGDPSLTDLPWEFLYDSKTHRFLALSEWTPIVRYLEVSDPVRVLPVTRPLRILVVIASPLGFQQLDGGREWSNVTASLNELVQTGRVEVVRLAEPTLSALQRQLRRDTYHVFHFIGHGGFDPQTQGGMLAMEDQQGRSRLVGGEDLGTLLHDHRSLRLAVLNAGEGARGDRSDPFSGTAQSLIQQGLPAVVAMQFEITDDAAITFGQVLYEAIADGYPLDAATAEARKAVYADGNLTEWGTPVLYLRAPDGRIFDIQDRPHSAFSHSSDRLEDEKAAQAQREFAEAPQKLDGRPDQLLTEVDLEPMRTCRDIEDIAAVHRKVILSELPDALTMLKRRFVTISHDVEVARVQETTFNQREALSRILIQLEGLSRELGREARTVRISSPGWYQAYSELFAPVAAQWRDIVALQVRHLEAEVERLQEIGSPYVVGVPLRDEQSIFVGRSDISTRIGRLLLHDPTPSLLLYGHRRMGKTSLLYNLGNLLPSTIVPLLVDLQGPSSHADSHAGLLYHLADAMAASARSQRHLDVLVPPREAFSRDPFSRFYEWLEDLDALIERRTALLMLDEFEALDRAFDVGRFSPDDVLGMLRHLIQHRPNFKVLLSGSHTIQEFRRWSSYLINVQVVKVGYLTESEARHLIERPVPDFPLQYHPDATRRVIEVTRCHPFLVQLLCAEIVALKNEQPSMNRRSASLGDVEQAAARALESGSMFFNEIEQNQIDTNALALLRAISARGEKATVRRRHIRNTFSGDWDSAFNVLRQRDLIEETRGGYRVQIEFIRRWFARRATRLSEL